MFPSRGGVFYDIAATDTSKLKRALLIISSIFVCGWLDDEQARSVRKCVGARCKLISDNSDIKQTHNHRVQL